ncbi:site-specific DNA-methyltransferase [Candidatus Poribacteria bacterium]|nr:site-specific DNA-methyltransferase [Candidatus Poribacteria bacterium]
MNKAKHESQRQGTQTSAFGTQGRINHDSSEFYKGKLYADQVPPEPETWIENPIPPENLDQLYCASSEKMSEIPDSSIHLMVTSPPYNAKKEYDDDLSLEEYRELLRAVFAETYNKLVTGGRTCINIANLGRKPYIPLHSHIIEDMLEIGYYMRGEIIWDKAASAGSSTAWGSWLSAANPVLRDVHEYILVFSKGSFSRKRNGKENTICKEDFLEWTKSVWTFPSVPAKRIGHPAPFPEELPHRLIQLYTFVGDVVLDPFCGSGTTCLSAIKSDRHYIGYDIEEKYIDLANDRINQYTNQIPLPI